MTSARSGTLIMCKFAYILPQKGTLHRQGAPVGTVARRMGLSVRQVSRILARR